MYSENRFTDINIELLPSSSLIYSSDNPPNPLRGPTPFEDMIFYLWTDSNEICTAYVKLNSKHILFMRIFWFSI